MLILNKVSLDSAVPICLCTVCGWLLGGTLAALSGYDHTARKPKILTSSCLQKKLAHSASSYWCHITYFCMYYIVQNVSLFCFKITFKEIKR